MGPKFMLISFLSMGVDASTFSYYRLTINVFSVIIAFLNERSHNKYYHDQIEHFITHVYL